MNKIFVQDYHYIENLKNNSIDAIIIDPPYEINYKNNQFNDATASIDWYFIFNQSYRLLKDSGNLVIFCGWSNLQTILGIIHDFPFLELKNMIVWDRQKTKNGGDKNFTSAREEMLWFVKSKNHTFNKEDSLIKKATKGFGSRNGSEYRRLSNVWAVNAKVS